MRLIPIKLLDKLILTSWTLVLLSGCGGESRPTLAKASGTVTYKGKGIENLAVEFTPAEGRPASGKTDAQGKFTLTTFDPDDGAVLGEHKVSVVFDSSSASNADSSGMGADAYSTEAPKSPIPEKYATTDTSGLTYTVKEGDDNVYTIELKD